ncbi:MAG: formylglycine-generating enzyme family protein [Spirochaetia bacterium]
MGSPQDEFTRDGNENRHSVTITKDFYISRYEVTQGEYRSVMGDTPSKQKIGIGDKYPVNNISWHEALLYCNKLSEQDGFTPAYTITGTEVIWHRNADGYRLPTRFLPCGSRGRLHERSAYLPDSQPSLGCSDGL